MGVVMRKDYKAILDLICVEMAEVESLSGFSDLLEKHGLLLDLWKPEETPGDLISVQEYLDSLLCPLNFMVKVWKNNQPFVSIGGIPLMTEEEGKAWSRSYVARLKKRLLALGKA
jgi:hypothetical protein